MVLSAAVCRVCDFCLIFVSFGHYDEPKILSYAIPLICPIGANVRQNTISIIGVHSIASNRIILHDQTLNLLFTLL